MTIPYVTFLKHAQKVKKTASAGRPILKGVYHAPDGSLAVTDSHRLYFAKNAHSNTESSVVEPKTGAVIEGNYPDVTKLLPDSRDAKYFVRLDVKQAVDAFAVLIKSAQVPDRKAIPTVNATVGDGRTLIFDVENIAMKSQYTAPLVVDGQGDKMTFNAQYFADALALFKDAGAAEVTMRYYGSTRPFTLTAGADDELLALILPIRTSK